MLRLRAGLKGNACSGVAIDYVYPWGRRLSEYINMFGLTPLDLSGRILDCGGGPASFNAEMRTLGQRATSCDPLYKFSGVEIARRITGTFDVVVEGARKTPIIFYGVMLFHLQTL